MLILYAQIMASPFDSMNGYGSSHNGFGGVPRLTLHQVRDECNMFPSGRPGQMG